MKRCQEDRRYLEALMDITPFAIYFKDASSRFTRVNAMMAFRLGLIDPDEAVGKTDYDFFDARHARESFEDERAIVSTGRPMIEKEEKEIWPDGTVTWVVSTKMPLLDPDGEVEGTLGFSRDITELKRGEEATGFLASLVEASDAAIIGLDRDGIVVSWNRGAESLYGYTAREMIGRSDFLLLPADRADELSQVKAEIRQAQRILRFETKHSTKDGKPVEVSMTVSPIRNSRGEVGGAVVVAENITERKQLEMELRQAQKLETIGHLAAGIAHEINTPIQYVGDNNRFLDDSFLAIGRVIAKHREFAERFRCNPDNRAQVEELRAYEEAEDLDYLLEEIPKAIGQSAEGVKRVANIVLAMKEFSHPDSAEKELVDINHSIENTLAVCRNEWKYVADVETTIDPNLPRVSCLGGEINQVILCLVVNAAHAIGSARKGSNTKGLIQISTRHDGEWAEIRVKDNGTGIPPSVQQRIFTPFFTTKEVGKGTGQGLSLAHTVVVKKHGGALTFETVEGQGTTFVVRIPVRGSAYRAVEEAA